MSRPIPAWKMTAQEKLLAELQQVRAGLETALAALPAEGQEEGAEGSEPQWAAGARPLGPGERK